MSRKNDQQSKLIQIYYLKTEVNENNIPALASNSSEVVSVFFSLFVSFIENLPQLRMHTVIFSPL